MERTSIRDLGPALGLGLLLQVLATLLVRWDAPDAAEPLVLRWLRVLADHPVRGALGLGLVVRACSPRAPREEASSAGSSVKYRRSEHQQRDLGTDALDRRIDRPVRDMDDSERELERVPR